MTPKPGRPTTLPEPWKSLVYHYGGLAKLAAFFGVSSRTIRRWAKTETSIPGPASKILAILLTKHNL